jgi:phage tail-like protein
MMMPEPKARFSLQGPNIPQDEILVGSEGMRLGRSGQNDLTLDHSEISRHHMQISRVMGSYWAEDLKSSNGVWVNDLRLKPGEPHELKIGDVVRCGPFVLRFEELVMPPVPEVSSEASVEPPPPPPAPESPDVPASVPGNGSTGLGGLTRPMRIPYGPKAPVPAEPPPTPVSLSVNGGYPIGIPTDRSNWLQYLPAIYSEDDFLGRYLLIFESVLNPIIWMIDNFDFYLSPELAPPEWLRWLASWFDLVLVPELPVDRQRAIMKQIGWLFVRRSTRVGLERLLELYFGVPPEIIESDKDPCHFTVRLPLSRASTRLGRDVADRLITSQKPAFASYTLEIT